MYAARPPGATRRRAPLDRSFQNAQIPRMARTKEFDPDAAVEAAMQLFWCRGYEATSVDDLVRHLGVGRGSLYATFGSKHALYLRALDRYRAHADAHVVSVIRGAAEVRPLVRGLLEGQVAEHVRDPERRGCMMANAATERGGCDAETAWRVGANFAAIEDALVVAIERARATGEIGLDRDARAVARFVVTTMQGLAVRAKADPDRAALQDSIEVALLALG
jgi:TetR/AcrR family transcriptional repressor of nem operon